MRRFLANETINFFGKEIIKKGDIVEVLDKFVHEEGGTAITVHVEDILLDSRFTEIKSNSEFKFEINEIDNSDIDQIKDWRMTLDLKTTGRKIQEIERNFRLILENLI